ncbi:MAG: cobalamin biosynthesis protein CobD [Chitinivibrionales bacterium]|nr:cobalamin biosynthesis protein CobD [Chitinivibrionales bacterium]
MSPLSLGAAVGLDFLLGDPRWLPHPVRWIGSLIALLEKLLHPSYRSRAREFISGMMLCALVLAITAGTGFLLVESARLLSPYAVLAVEAIIGFYCLSARSLASEANLVRKHLSQGDLSAARHAVSMIVGRDTANMNEHEIARATVETVAENITDGIVSPLFYLALGGPVAALAFKSVSTMDSMIGYRNDRYRHFGTCAARLDDILNFIPARLAGFIMIPLTTAVSGKNLPNSLQTIYRDRKKHPSPNSAHSEAAMAGALDIELGGEATYNGRISRKPRLNEGGRQPVMRDIADTVTIAYGTALLSAICAISAVIVSGRSIL